MSLNIKELLARPLGALRLQGCDETRHRPGPVLLANPGFFLKHDLRADCLVLVSKLKNNNTATIHDYTR